MPAQTRHAQLREDYRRACDDYFEAIAVRTTMDRDHYARALAAIALKLHLFEQGMRAKK